MSGFKIEGGGSRGGKMAAIVDALHTHEMERIEAALRATVAHLGVLDDEARARVLRTRVMTGTSVIGEEMGHRETSTVRLDGVAVWKGEWRWEGHTASWREECLTPWMREALEPAKENER